MGIFSKLFSRSDNKESNQQTSEVNSKAYAMNEISKQNSSDQSQLGLSLKSQNSLCHIPEFSVHSDIQELLWWVDGPYKNYTPTKSTQRIDIDNYILEISLTGMNEPSLLSTQEPINVNVVPSSVERLPYYPVYSHLSPEQRGVYWQFLRNPYSGLFEIGYVFILYYGLERHLLTSMYEKAFRVILKLRDVYSNKSFQFYSGCALVIPCLIHNRIDLLSEFFASLDKDYELDFSANLYMLGKFGLRLPLTSRDIMRMAKDFEFSNLNYIKKYPAQFEQMLQELIQSKYGFAQLDINSIIGISEWTNVPKIDVPVFANISIENKTIPVPQIIGIKKLKQEVFDLLEATHNAVKINASTLRKEGRVPSAKESFDSIPEKTLTLDTDMEKSLMTLYHNAVNDPVAKHFSMISLQDFYYKYRNLDSVHLSACIHFCKEDIENLEHFMNAWRKQKDGSPVRIPSFHRLAIILENSKEYKQAIQICEQAEVFYQTNGPAELADEFKERKEKLSKQIQKAK